MKTLLIIFLLTAIPSLLWANPWFEANRRCKDMWPDNQRMRDYCIDNQVKAYNSTPKASSDIENKCDLRWGTDFKMKKYCIEQEKAKQGTFEVVRDKSPDASSSLLSSPSESYGDNPALILEAQKNIQNKTLIFKAGTNNIVFCPSCGTSVYYDKSLAGKKIACIRCRQTNVFP